MEITRGKIQKAKKVVIYGPEGIGKSTFAARFPGAVFIDTEGSTNDMDVARLPRPTSWNMLFDEIEYIKTHTDECRTLVIDTIELFITRKELKISAMAMDMSTQKKSSDGS